MKLSLRIIEADNIPKMDLLGKADPFVVVYMSESHDKDQTEYKSKTYTPKWDKQMYLKVISISEHVKFELKDHDSGGKSELIGTFQRRIKDFQPGIVRDEWLNLEKAKGAKKAARIHIVSHLAFDTMDPFVQIPFQFLKVCVHIQGIKGLSKANPSETFNPYLLVGIERCPTIRFKTKELRNTKEPVWNEVIPVEVTNPNSDLLAIIMRDKVNAKDVDSAFLSIPLYQFQIYGIYDHEYDMAPLNGLKNAGKITLKIQVLPLDAPNWTQPMYQQPPMYQQGYYQQPPQMYQQQMMQPGMHPQQPMQGGNQQGQPAPTTHKK